MRKTIAVFCFLALPAGGSCFFFGLGQNKAQELYAAIEADFERGDCTSVLEKAEAFLKEGPPARLKETVYRYTGVCYERDGLADRAVSLYKLASGLYPENYFFMARLADIYLNTGFYSNAIPLFTKIIAARSYDAAANLGLARAYARLGFLARSKAYYSRAVALTDFGDMTVLQEYAAVMVDKRDWPEALMLAGKGIKAAPLDAYWPRTLARIRAGQGDFSEAAAQMNLAQKLSPGRRSIQLEKALYELLGGNSAGAISGAEAGLAELPADPLAALIKGLALYKEGKAEQAKTYFESAAKNGEPFTAKVAGVFLK